MAKAKFDVYQHVTDEIIAQIEAGTPPWRKPWTGGAAGAQMPARFNGEDYRGINVLMLWATAASKGYASAGAGAWGAGAQGRDVGHGGEVRHGRARE